MLAALLGPGAALPPMLGEPRTCGSCFQRSNCALLHRVIAHAPVCLHDSLRMPYSKGIVWYYEKASKKAPVQRPGYA